MDLFYDLCEKPTHEYKGKLLHYGQIKGSHYSEPVWGTITTSYEARKFDYLIHIYHNGKRVFGKRANKEKAIVHESIDLIRSVIHDIKRNYAYESTRSGLNKSKDN